MVDLVEDTDGAVHKAEIECDGIDMLSDANCTGKEKNDAHCSESSGLLDSNDEQHHNRYSSHGDAIEEQGVLDISFRGREKASEKSTRTGLEKQVIPTINRNPLRRDSSKDPPSRLSVKLDGAVSHSMSMQSKTRAGTFVGPQQQPKQEHPTTSGLPSKDNTFRNIQVSGSTSVLFGNTISNIYTYGDTPSDNLFANFALNIKAKPNKSKQLFRAGRQQPHLSVILNDMPVTKYTPYADVGNQKVSAILRQVAETFQFINKGFAQYFRTAVSTGPELLDDLRSIRKEISQRQVAGATWVGNLGEFCEEASKSDWLRKSAKLECCDNSLTEQMQYLQDALEVPYWDLIADRFVCLRADKDANKDSIQVVYSVLRERSQEILRLMGRIEEKFPGEIPDPIFRGITARLSVIDRILENDATHVRINRASKRQTLQFNYARTILNVPPNEAPAETGIGSAETSGTVEPNLAIDSSNRTELEKVNAFTLFILFLIPIFTFSAIGFSGYYHAKNVEDARGSTSDPDFWWLIASTCITILGNLFAVVPLFKLVRGSLAIWTTGLFLLISCALGAWSVIVYPSWNKCWSSILSVFCGLFAVASVYVSAQGTSNRAEEAARRRGGKKKQD